MPGTPFFSRAAREAVVDVAAELSLADVRRAFTDEGFAPFPGALAYRPSPAAQEQPKWVTAAEILMVAAGSMSATSRALAKSYLDGVDWTSAAKTLAALGAVEELLWLFERSAALEEDWDSLPGERLRRRLDKEGFHIDSAGRVHPSHALLLDGSLGSLSDPALIQQVLRRINKALPDDPMLAIGSAKELVEGTAKAVLTQLGKPFPATADMPVLVRQAEEALLNHPTCIDGDADGAPSVKRLLGKLTGMTDDLAKLRNEYGTGHAPSALPVGLEPRHGRLAVAAAAAWCTFMLDSLPRRT